MKTAELMLALLGAVVVLALLARRLRVPEPVMLVVGGFGLAALPFMPRATIDPDIVLLVFLPPILFPSAFALAREDLRPALRPIAWLSVGLVLATAAAVAVAAHIVLGVPWAAAVVLGAILGPTDPVSATAVLRSSGAPPRLVTILEGESLINDGTSLTVFRVALAAVGAAFSVPEAIGQFFLIAVGGAVFGAVVGWAVSELLRRLEETEIESAVAVLTAYGSYVVAEQVGISGILAVVAAGLVIGLRMSEITSPETRLRAGSFWSLLQFLAVSILFVLVGFVVGDELGSVSGTGLADLAGATAAVTAAVVLTRAVWMFTVPYVLQKLSRDDEDQLPPREMAVLILGGLRGAVSAALALAIPMTAHGGGAFPHRDAIVVVALMSVVILLVVPALAMPALLPRLNLKVAPDEQGMAEARGRMAEAALKRADELAEHGELSEDLVRRAHEVYDARIAAAHHTEDARADRAGHYRTVLRELVEAERDELHRLQSEGVVVGEPLRELEHGLDVEERRLT